MNIRLCLPVLLACLVMAVLPVAVLGNEASASIPVDLVPQLRQIHQLEGSFEQTRHISVLSLPLRSSGQFTYRQEEGIVWRTLEPVASTVRISPEQGVVIVDDSGNQQPVPASELIGGIFLGIFSADFSRLNDYFAIEKQPANAALDTHHWHLKLTPLQAGLADHLQAVEIRGAELVEAITLREANGDRTEIVFKAEKIVGKPD